MVLVTTIHRCLHEAEKEGNAELLVKAFHSLQASLDRSSATCSIDLENLILCGEVAIKVGAKGPVQERMRCTFLTGSSLGAARQGRHCGPVLHRV